MKSTCTASYGNATRSLLDMQSAFDIARAKAEAPKIDVAGYEPA